MTAQESSPAHPQFASALREPGLDVEVHRIPDGTRTAQQAADLDHAVVRAAAGTPYTVFAMDPKTVVAQAGGTPVDVREFSA
ncbi:hypothetical protein ACFXGT_14695 [Streptomyces sp. NPDC059352]|uniref:hypothetical protein n=1 Tax=Streptomyces sp. NPDC059352 TaxID=3346810 RepID=UPI0036896021